MSPPPPEAVRIRPVRTRRDLLVARRLIRAYGASIGVDLEFQHFERELKELPGDYRRPGGDLWIAVRNGRPVGCAALRPLGRGRAEMKRLYVRPRARGTGVGRRLARVVVRAAGQRGYRWVYLDTLATMTPALRLYRTMGFTSVRPYRYNPIPGSRFLRLRLPRSRPVRTARTTRRTGSRAGVPTRPSPRRGPSRARRG